MQKQPLLAWTTANALGLGVGFVALMDPLAPFKHGLHFESYWEPVPPGQGLWEIVGTLVAYLIGGLVLGSAQAVVLRSRMSSVSSWILTTVAGFGVLAVTIAWPLQATGILGRIPGPVEPIIATVGSCTVAGVFQYLLLRRRGVRGSRWLVLWIVGLVVSIVPTALLFMSLGALGVAVSWPAEVFLNGFVCAGTAALASGGAFLGTIAFESARGTPYECRAVRSA